jgi:hypothetical protein
VTDWLERFLEPTFDDSAFAGTGPSHGAEWLGLVAGAAMAVAGIAAAYYV